MAQCEIRFNDLTLFLMTYTVGSENFSLVYSLSGTPTVPQVGGHDVGNVTSTADFHGFEYIFFPYSSNGTVDYCGSSTTVCRFLGYHNYNLPRDRYCIIVVNPNNVDYYTTIVYSFGGTGTNAFGGGSSARRSIDNSAKSPKKNISFASSVVVVLQQQRPE
ncbi:2617_t:CDS:2 [Cetraspora pellucida]|uniref:2617_t:CDS:1 n=1 Tax=Cetraspora pellucida TaxID=1433469 RepID=A0ACA9MJW5_9GLOM|nr:2617_t:CDS:2 [Cetraspora pellucida]